MQWFLCVCGDVKRKRAEKCALGLDICACDSLCVAVNPPSETATRRLPVRKKEVDSMFV